MQAMTQLAHDFLIPVLHPRALCVDGTLGRGRDTIFFIEQKVGSVFYYEIQPDLFERFQTELNAMPGTGHQRFPHVTGFAHSHEQILQDLREYEGCIDAVIFNYGYDPKTLCGIATQADSSLSALKQCVRLLRKKGRMALVFYPHPEGEKEKAVLMDWLKDQTSLEILEIKHPFNPRSPSLICLEKIK